MRFCIHVDPSASTEPLPLLVWTKSSRKDYPRSLWLVVGHSGVKPAFVTPPYRSRFDSSTPFLRARSVAQRALASGGVVRDGFRRRPVIEPVADELGSFPWHVREARAPTPNGR